MSLGNRLPPISLTQPLSAFSRPWKLQTGSDPGLGPGGTCKEHAAMSLCVGHTRCLPKRPLACLVDSSWRSAAKASCCLSPKGRVHSELAEQAPKRTKRHSTRCDRPRGKYRYDLIK